MILLTLSSAVMSYNSANGGTLDYKILSLGSTLQNMEEKRSE